FLGAAPALRPETARVPEVLLELRAYRGSVAADDRVEDAAVFFGGEDEITGGGESRQPVQAGLVAEAVDDLYEPRIPVRLEKKQVKLTVCLQESCEIGGARRRQALRNEITAPSD